MPAIESGSVTNRIGALRRLMDKEDLQAMLVSSLSNVRYLCGFSGSSGTMLVTRKSAWFFTDFRYKEQTKQEVRGCRSRILSRGLFADFPVEYIRGVKRLGVEQDHMNIATFKLLRKRLKGPKLVPARDLVLRLRRTKDKTEVALIRKAQAVTDSVFRWLLDNTRPGVTERELGAEIEYRFKRHGESAFPPIAASGPNSALPHASPSDRRLRRGDAVTFDMGCRRDGYCSDMTRTFFLGKPNDDLRQVYLIVAEAQKRALAGIRPGASCAEVDALARDYIRDEGYGPYFGHGLGHGVGLLVHEQPGLSHKSKDKLAEGDVVTVEPGIYLPGLGGVRIEDMVLVTRNGYENLTKSPKELIEL